MPPGRVTSSGPEFVEYGEAAGLTLDPWQADHLDDALSERADGNWVASQVGLIVPRQNGKDSELEVLELGALFLLRLPLIIHTTHRYATTMEHYLRVSSLIKENPALDAQVANYYTANGNCSIVLKDGCRLKFLARAGGNARGFAGVRLLILNEAFKLDFDLMGAMGPTMLTRRDRQVWYVSSPPKADSEVLHDVRRRGMAGDAKRLFYCAWENQPGTSIHDHDALARVNPGYGVRIMPDAFDDALVELGAAEFERECLGVPELPDGGANVFGPGKWQACESRGSQIVGEPVVALDVGPDMAWASFAGAGRTVDGLSHIELIRRDEGTGWIVDEAVRLACPVVVNPGTPTAAFLAPLKEAGVTVIEVKVGEFPKACATLQAAVIDSKVRHIGQGPLDAAVNGAAIRTAGETWVWAAARSSVDISPLVACTLALWQLEHAGGTSEYHSFVEA